jgi:formylmethanofuran dehydrogenase subunit C
MFGYILSWKEQPAGTVDASGLRPDLLGHLPLEELERQRLRVGNREYRLGELFAILGDPGLSMTITGNANYLMLAQGMAAGELIVHGEAGDLAGMALRGGTLRILGSAGHSLGASMTGGQIEVLGDAGPRVGGPAPTSIQGMSDGEILIQGKAGPEAGFRLRRGTIAMTSCDELPGHHMLAGTLVIVQGPLANAGVNARRGSILGLDPQAEPSWVPRYQPDCVHRPVFVQVLLRHLQKQKYPIPPAAVSGPYRHYSGDRLNTGQAEILHWLGE